MRKVILFLLLAIGIATAQEKMVSVPESQLTEQQKADLLKQNANLQIQNIHGWAGLGKEISEAISGSLSAVTTQTNNFAHTGIGEVTIALVVWKVLGDQAFHLVGAIIEMLVFIPIFLWSYRKMCMTRRIVTSKEGFFGKKTWQVVPYDGTCDFTPRIAHGIVLAVFSVVWIVTMFAY